VQRLDVKTLRNWKQGKYVPLPPYSDILNQHLENDVYIIMVYESLLNFTENTSSKYLKIMTYIFPRHAQSVNLKSKDGHSVAIV